MSEPEKGNGKTVPGKNLDVPNFASERDEARSLIEEAQETHLCNLIAAVDSLQVIALYHVRKGEIEGIWSPEDRDVIDRVKESGEDEESE